MPRSNRERTDATRTALLDAARGLFVEKGYAETATPDIVAAAGVTRGALYHHFEDKLSLFTQVVNREADAVAAHIDASSASADTALQALIQGASAYFDAMAVPGRTKLLLREAPALVERDPVETTLKIGMAALLDGSSLLQLVDPLTTLISAAFDRAALAIADGGDRLHHEAAIRVLLEGLEERPASQGISMAPNCGQ